MSLCVCCLDVGLHGPQTPGTRAGVWASNRVHVRIEMHVFHAMYPKCALLFSLPPVGAQLALESSSAL